MRDYAAGAGQGGGVGAPEILALGRCKKLDKESKVSSATQTVMPAWLV